jgi:phage-related holin
MIEVKQIGIGVLFNLLFIVYEIISILKNMVKCKLPIPKKLQSFLEKILNEFTTELKENDKNDKGN